MSETPTSETPTTDAFMASRHYDYRIETYAADFYAAIDLARKLETLLREFVRIDEEDKTGLMAWDGLDISQALIAAKEFLKPRAGEN